MTLTLNHDLDLDLDLDFDLGDGDQVPSCAPLPGPSADRFTGQHQGPQHPCFCGRGGPQQTSRQNPARSHDLFVRVPREGQRVYRAAVQSGGHPVCHGRYGSL